MEGVKATASGFKKAKKKQVKDELDRMKQAEKKKRRLEKALATSAAIISELEKKKQKKKEEQERLDLEGAAIAEAVALHVLHGEDSDDSIKKKNEGLTSRDRAGNMGVNILAQPPLLIPYQEPPMYFPSGNNTRWASDTRRYELMQSHCGNSGAIAPPARLVRGFYPQHSGIGGWGLSADHLAAQAVSSLRIADEARVDAYAFNRALKG